MALFGAAVVLLFGAVYLSTVSVIEGQVADTVEAELRGLAEGYRSEGITGLLATIERRSGAAGDPDSVYLVTNARLQRLAGNLRSVR